MTTPCTPFPRQTSPPSNSRKPIKNQCYSRAIENATVDATRRQAALGQTQVQTGTCPGASTNRRQRQRQRRGRSKCGAHRQPCVERGTYEWRCPCWRYDGRDKAAVSTSVTRRSPPTTLPTPPPALPALSAGKLLGPLVSLPMPKDFIDAVQLSMQSVAFEESSGKIGIVAGKAQILFLLDTGAL